MLTIEEYNILIDLLNNNESRVNNKLKNKLEIFRDHEILQKDFQEKNQALNEKARLLLEPDKDTVEEN